MIARRRFVKGLLGVAGSGILGTAVPAWADPLAYSTVVPSRKPAVVHGFPGLGEGSPGAFPDPPRKPQRYRPRVVMLDAGHGGKDPGAIGVRGTREKDVNLDIVLEMARLLGQVPGVTPKLTRGADVFLPLKERVARAREVKADLFLSLHADSAPNTGARGLSAYTLSAKASNGFAAALADKENLVDGPHADLDASQEVMAILADLVFRHTRNASLYAQTSLVEGVHNDVRLFENPVQAANFAVLKAPDVPSVLIETGFLSNVEDEALLRDRKARRRIAAALAREVGSIMRMAPFS